MTKYFRRVFKIRGEDSPNVKLALAEIAAGKRPSHTELVAGVLPYSEYRKRLATWDKVRICIGIHGEFYEGAELLLFPPEWLNNSASIAQRYLLEGRVRRVEAVGVDPAEGGDKTSMVAIDRLGVIARAARKTPDTDVVVREVLAFCKSLNFSNWTNLAFDRGGGGKQHADRMRGMGYAVRTIAFGEAVVKEVDDTKNGRVERKETKESAYEFKNRRAQMYGELSENMDPTHPEPFAIPSEYSDLRDELAPFPKMYDPEGRLILPPKGKTDPNSTVVTLKDLIGHSPDIADGLVLAHHVLYHVPKKKIAKAG